MRMLFIFCCLLGFLVCGCSTVCVQMLGMCDNWTECKISDSETNRSEAVRLAQNLAGRFGLLDESEKNPSGIEKGTPGRPGDSVHLCKFVTGSRDGIAQKLGGISLSVYSRQNVIVITLFQQKWRKRRTKQYLAIQNDLVAEFKQYFGPAAHIKIYDEVSME